MCRCQPRRLRGRGGITLTEEAAVELLLSGYVMDSRTVHKGISQFQPGEALYWSGGTASLHRHYRFLRTEVSTDGPDALTATLHATMDEAFARLAQQFAGQRVIVPLSAGLDSRLVIAMLKRHGHRDLVAMTYGRRDSREADMSRAVADALDIRWEFLPSTRMGAGDGWSPAPPMRRFWRDAEQAAALPHLQDYLALQQLRQRDPGLRAVVLPGYVGDVVAKRLDAQRRTPPSPGCRSATAPDVPHQRPR